MDNSTDGVTLYAGFIFDVLGLYEGSRGTFAGPLFEMAKDLDPGEPTAMVPIQQYNDVCDWLENKLGPANLRKAGAAIGERAYEQILADGAVGSDPTPVEMLEQLKRVASLMIQDPKGRGWEILDAQDKSIRMRRTQTFNCFLQEGLIHALVQKTGVTLPKVEHASCTRRGDEFCEYVVKWM